ncbi:MAG: J domain-containing protein [Verrucomicrobiota bacterium]
MESDLTPYYKTLGLLPGATESQIQEAYQELNSVWHPDRFSHDSQLYEQAKHQLKTINIAYSRLCTANVITDTRTIEIEASGVSAVENAKFEQAEQELSKISTTITPNTRKNKQNVAKETKTIQSSGRPIMRLRSNIKKEPVTVFETLKSPKITNTETPQSTQQIPPLARPRWNYPKTFIIILLLLLSLLAVGGFYLYDPNPSFDLADHQPVIQDEVLTGKTNIDQTKDEPEITLVHDQNNSITTAVTADKKTKGKSQDLPIVAEQKSELTSQDPAQSTQPSFITIGSTYEDVERIQGTPSSRTTEQWNYRFSHIIFDNGKVSAWTNTENIPLRVQLLPEKTINPIPTYFTFNSTKDEVLAIQGTPTVITDQYVWRYDFSTIIFNDQDRVIQWVEDPSNPSSLKARKIHSPGL